jgi:hypothetical protein
MAISETRLSDSQPSQSFKDSCIDFKSLFRYTEGLISPTRLVFSGGQESPIELVDTRAILVAPSWNNWDDAFGGESRTLIDHTIQQIKQQDLSAIPSVELGKVDDLYAVYGRGRRLVAVAKKIGIPKIRAHVSPLAINTALAFGNESEKELIRRQYLGLWEGERFGDPEVLPLRWRILKAKGPWVFAEDMGQAKNLYLFARSLVNSPS